MRALTRLREALVDARNDAKDAYFGPALVELQPLLVRLHPGAQLIVDDATLLPATLFLTCRKPAFAARGGEKSQVRIKQT